MFITDIVSSTTNWGLGLIDANQASTSLLSASLWAEGGLKPSPAGLGTSVGYSTRAQHYYSIIIIYFIEENLDSCFYYLVHFNRSTN